MNSVKKKPSNLQEALGKHNQGIAKRKEAGHLKGKSINIHNQLDYLGGIEEVIQSLNEGCLEFALKATPLSDKDTKTLYTLRQTRDLLIKEHFGQETLSLVEFMLK